MSGYELGQPVMYTGTVSKVRDRIRWLPKVNHRLYEEARENWGRIKDEPGRAEFGLLRTRLVEFPLAEGQGGVIVGKRTIWQGVTEYSGYGEPPCFLPCEHSQVYLVAHNLRRKPVMCFDHQIEPTP